MKDFMDSISPSLKTNVCKYIFFAAVSQNTLRHSFYEKLSTFDTFGNGWTRRNDETKEKALEMMYG